MKKALLALMSGGGGNVIPSPLILTWYNSLAVKPSNALLTSLNTLAEGLDADANWAKLDLFGLVAGMETDEQRLRPLITTSGDDFVISGVPVLNANGIRNAGGAGYLDLKWNPTDDGSQYSINSAFISTQIGSAASPGFGTAYYMGSADTASFGDSYFTDTEGGALTGTINDDGGMVNPQITNVTSTFYTAIVLTGGNKILYKNATTNTVAFAAPVLINLDFFGCNASVDGAPVGSAEDSYLRHFMAGAGTANQTTIQSRLNTFYAARGL